MGFVCCICVWVGDCCGYGLLCSGVGAGFRVFDVLDFGLVIVAGFVVVQCEYNLGFSVCVVMISRVGLVAFWI